MKNFWVGFEKASAFGNTKRIINKLKGLVTGKETLYHNTTAYNARKILKEGLIPGKGKGMGQSLGLGGSSDRAFLAWNPDMATSMGKAPYAIPQYKRLQKLYKKLGLGKLLPSGKSKDSKAFLGYLLGTKIPGGPSGVQLKFEIPKKVLKKLETSTDVGRLSEVALKGKLDPKYIKKVKR